MSNTWLAIAGAFIALTGLLILAGVKGVVSPKRNLSVRRRRLTGLGFVLLGLSLVLQGVWSGSVLMMLLSVLLACAALAAFIGSLVLARREADTAESDA
ncbi:MAG: hypothetical protein U0R64_01965 [Candidatus Nanopelagicales bacterium]